MKIVLSEYESFDINSKIKKDGTYKFGNTKSGNKQSFSGLLPNTWKGRRRPTESQKELSSWVMEAAQITQKRRCSWLQMWSKYFMDIAVSEFRRISWSDSSLNNIAMVNPFHLFLSPETPSWTWIFLYHKMIPVH